MSLRKMHPFGRYFAGNSEKLVKGPLAAATDLFWCPAVACWLFPHLKRLAIKPSLQIFRGDEA